MDILIEFSTADEDGYVNYDYKIFEDTTPEEAIKLLAKNNFYIHDANNTMDGVYLIDYKTMIDGIYEIEKLDIITRKEWIAYLQNMREEKVREVSKIKAEYNLKINEENTERERKLYEQLKKKFETK